MEDLDYDGNQNGSLVAYSFVQLFCFWFMVDVTVCLM